MLPSMVYFVRRFSGDNDEEGERHGNNTRISTKNRERKRREKKYIIRWTGTRSVIHFPNKGKRMLYSIPRPPKKRRRGEGVFFLLRQKRKTRADHC